MRTRPADFRVELGYLRDNLLSAIQDQKTSRLHDGLEIYENLVSSFIDKLQEWDSPYDKKRAMQEVTSIGGDWSEIKWINDDLRELIDAGVAAKNHHIMHELFLLLYKLTRNALTNRDYYIFYRSVVWFPYIFQASSSLPEGLVKRYLVNHSVLGINEIANLFVFPELERAQSSEDLDRIRDFGQGMVVVFSQLLRDAYYASDFENFSAFVPDLVQMFLGASVGQRSAERLARLTVSRLNPHLSSQEVARIEKEINLAKRRMAIVSELAEYKNLALFGIGAIVLRDYREDKLSVENFGLCYRYLPKVSNLEEAWQLYVHVTDEVKSDFGWEWWGLTGGGHGPGFWGGIDQDLQLNFLVRSLEVLEGTPEGSRNAISLPDSADLPPLAENENSPLRRLLVDMELAADKWLLVLGRGTLDGIPALREIMAAAVLSERRRQAEVLIDTNLSPGRIDQLKLNVLKGWSENALLRELVNEIGTFRSGLVAPAGAPSFGINRRDRKDVYVEGSGYPIDRWGEQYGGSIGRGEDELVLNKLSGAASLLAPDPVQESEIFDYLDQGLAKLRRNGYNPVILALNFWQIESVLEGRVGFARGRMGVRGYWRLGNYQGSAVYTLRYPGSPQLLCVDLKKIGQWVQYAPTRTAEDEVVLGEHFLFSIRPITRAQALDLLVKFPQLRQGPEGEIRPEEELVWVLQQEVHLRVVEQFDYQIVDPNAALAVRFG
jgi:hypothetical protein